jgi:peptide/nickel transport system ATP-binding protein
VSTLLQIEDLSIAFRAKTKDKRLIPAIDNVSFQVKKGETIGLVGESGCGKTITSLAIMGLLPEAAVIQGGEIRLQEENLLALKEAERNSVRGVRIGMIFQDPMTSLSPYYTVGNQIMEGLRHHMGMSKREARERARELLVKVGIPSPERVLDEYPSGLSGGMRQRVMIAIAISCEPDLLIADEPTTALDVTTQAQILDLLCALQRENNMGMILISHDLGVIAEMCSRVMVMYAGQIIEENEAARLFQSPGHPYTNALLAATPRLTGPKSRFHQIPGQVPTPDEWGTGCRFRSRCPLRAEACGEMPPMYKLEGNKRVRCWFATEQTMAVKGVRA